MESYETNIICVPDLSSEKLSAIIEKIKSIITKDGGEIVSVNEWGKKRLTYSISKCQEGIYVNIEFISKGPITAKLENMYRLAEGVIRYLTVKKKKELKTSKKDKKKNRDDRGLTPEKPLGTEAPRV